MGTVTVQASESAEVTRVFVKKGQTVKAREALVRLDNEFVGLDVLSPQNGMVISVHIDPGATVRAGDNLVILSTRDVVRVNRTPSSI